MTDTSAAMKLAEPFDSSMLKSRNKGGAKLTYVPVAEVIARLNFVLGVENWNVESADAWRDELDPNWVIAKVTLKARINGEWTQKIGFGGQEVKGKRDGGAPLDLGDEFKGAMSDALKKAATLLGVALDLARDEEALIIEEEQRHLREEESKPKATPEMVAAIVEFRDGLDKESDEFNEFRDWWIENISKKAESGKVTMDEAQLAIEQFGIIVDLGRKKAEASSDD